MYRFAIAALIGLGFSSVAHASNVFSDNFDTENGGATALQYTGFANFNVTGGVDLVKNGDYGVMAFGNTGSAVDLSGTPGPGQLTSIASFNFNAGDQVRLSYELGGDQRGGTEDWYADFFFSGATGMLNYGFNYFGADVIAFPGLTTTTFVGTGTGISSSDPYALRSIFFTAASAGSLTFAIGTTTAGNVGPMLDNVSLDISPVPEPSSLALAGLGGLSLVIGAYRRRRAQKSTI